MEEKISEVPHNEGVYHIAMEHKFIISSIAIIVFMFIFKDAIDKDFIMLSIVIASLIFLFSLFVELPRSRYPILQMIGQLAWYIAIGSALFMGWTRWTNN